jgi:nitrogen regulatory protein PII 1
MMLIVIPEKDKEFLIETIVRAARTGDKGNYGDGKIFVSPVEEVYTVSTGIKEL